MADNISTFPLSSVYRFPYFQTREQYQSQSGLTPPAYDPTKRVKGWADPAPAMIGNVVMYKSPVVDSSGQVVEQPFVLSKAEAMAVNIPPHAAGVPDAPVIGEVPPPTRDLKATEKYITVGPLQIIEVKDTSIPDPILDQPSAGGGGFTQTDRDLLGKIAKALGVS